ncbi:protein TolQ [Sphingomonas flavalba]|uniref:protein TolQ n=1 Tax=Sphingomonas flavalba TaxID=2559804 RepID=UPI0039DFBD5D
MDLFVNSDAATLSPVGLFLQADWVVKMVMLGLLAASIWSWAIIIGFGRNLGRMARRSAQYEADFWKAQDIDRFHDANGRVDLPAARVLDAGVREWRRSTNGKRVDREGIRSRLHMTMAAAIGAEIDKLSGRLTFLATIGSVAPFVGLFGTVWGIMRAFTGIAAEKSSSIAVVAPGIAEALFATAIGLFAAIPAVIAYNRFSHSLDRLEARLGRFADGFHATLSRELDAEA